MTTHLMLIIMTSLQLLWVLGMWWTNVAPRPEKLLLVFVLNSVAAVCALSLPSRLIQHWHTRWEHLSQHERWLWRIGALFFFPAASVYAYYFQGWPDEPHVFASATLVAEQGLYLFFRNYEQMPWLGGQHPPLAILFYGLVLHYGGGSLFAMRCAALPFSFLTLVCTYRIGTELANRTIGVLAVFWLCCMPFFFRLTPVALTDMHVTCCITAAVALTLRLVRTPSLGLATVIGAVIGIGLLCKYTMVFVYPVLLVVVACRGDLRQLWRLLLVAFCVSGAIVAPWIEYAIHEGIFAHQQADLGRIAGSVIIQGGRKYWILKMLAFRLPSGIGVSYLPLIGFGLWRMAQRRHQSDYLIGGWILAVALPLLLTFPGPRYFLPMFPALAIAMAYGTYALHGERARLLILASLFTCAALYLFIDWDRAAGEFVTEKKLETGWNPQSGR